MDPSKLLPIQFVVSLTAYALIYVTLAGPQLKRLEARMALLLLAAPHLFRHLGANLLVEGVVSPDMPANFARMTAAGDAVTVVLAALAMCGLHFRWRHAATALWVFNGFGLADLLHNLSRAAPLGVAPELHAAWYVPAFVVPGMLAAHVASLATLWKRRASLHEELSTT